MYKSERHLVTILLLLSILSATSLAQQTGDDAVYLKMVKEFRLNTDGRWSFTQSHQLQLLSYFAVSSRYGETFIVYNPQFQTLTVRRNATTMANGKLVKAPDNAHNEVLPGFAANAPAYNHLREMVVTHTALELGSVIDLEYEIENSADFYPGMMGDEILAADSPIRELIVRIRVPDQQPFHYHLYNAAGQPKESSFGGETEYEWTFGNLSAIPPERQQPPLADFAPRLVFSANSNWQQAFAALLKRSAFNAVPDGPLKKVAVAARDLASDEWDYILKMQNMAAMEIATFAIPPAVTGFRLRPPAEVWRSNGGALAEKAVVLRDLLRFGGVLADVALMSTGSVVADDFPVLMSFDRAIVRVTDSKGRQFFMPVDQPARLDLNYPLVKQTAVILTDDKVDLGMIPRVEAQTNSARMAVRLVMDEAQKFSGQVSLELSGAAYPWFEFIQNPNAPEKMLQSIMNESSVSALRLRNMDEMSFTAEAHAEKEHPFRVQDNFLFWNLPVNPAGIESWHLPVMSAHRATPLKLPYPLAEETQITLTLPAGYQLALPAVDIKKENGCGKAQISIAQVKDQVKILRRIEINRHYLPVDEYANWLELWRLWQAPNYRELILKKK